jgi:hypothetical protein
MKDLTCGKAAAFATMAMLLISQRALATESGVGRPLTGMQIKSHMGYVPTDSEWIFSISTIYYEGSLDASRKLPVGRTVEGGLDYKVEYTMINAVKSWGISVGGWNFASAFGIPIQYSNASSVHGVLPHDQGLQFADIFLVPVEAGYHFTNNDHAALSMQIYAPTGAYNPDRLANSGQNTWTFTPTLAYTKLIPSTGIELSLNYGVNLYTPNSSTGYHNAPVSVLDVLMLKTLKHGWRAGVAGGYIQQLGDDTRGIADAVNGFVGRSVGVGPVVTWDGKLSKTPVSASLSWVSEFNVRNRPKGNAVNLSVTAAFE